ncbi:MULTISPECIES: cytotoxic necrotizing factor Rho-activating domain-containing protein [Xenorhabdus]|uniref:cytotoxic necrotizing factor Rho-activating domain-containing protein n=1 Tax=Xenorhabdus TaxID=626 RepID=UPI00064852F9|nr:MULTISPECIES: cytotoxic necrotizing factor Rho-activating domain-containing protein [Xenorhabdus]
MPFHESIILNPGKKYQSVNQKNISGKGKNNVSRSIIWWTENKWKNCEIIQPGEGKLPPITPPGLSFTSEKMDNGRKIHYFILVNGLYWRFKPINENLTSGYISNSRGDKLRISYLSSKSKRGEKSWKLKNRIDINNYIVESMFKYTQYPDNIGKLLKKELQNIFAVRTKLKFIDLMNRLDHALTIKFFQAHEGNDLEKALYILLAKQEIYNKRKHKRTDEQKILDIVQQPLSESLLDTYLVAFSSGEIQQDLYKSLLQTEISGDDNDIRAERTRLNRSFENAKEVLSKTKKTKEKYCEKIKHLNFLLDEYDFSVIGKSKSEIENIRNNLANDIEKLNIKLDGLREKERVENNDLKTIEEKQKEFEKILDIYKAGIDKTKKILSSVGVKDERNHKKFHDQSKSEFEYQKAFLTLVQEEIKIKDRVRESYSDEECRNLQILNIAKYHLSTLRYLKGEYGYESNWYHKSVSHNQELNDFILIDYFEGWRHKNNLISKIDIETPLAVEGSNIQIPIMGLLKGNISESIKQKIIFPDGITDEMKQDLLVDDLNNKINKFNHAVIEKIKRLFTAEETVKKILAPYEYIQSRVNALSGGRVNLEQQVELKIEPVIPDKCKLKINRHFVSCQNISDTIIKKFSVYELILKIDQKEFNKTEYRNKDIKYLMNSDVEYVVKGLDDISVDYERYISGFRNNEDVKYYINEGINKLPGSSGTTLEEFLDKYTKHMDEISYSSSEIISDYFLVALREIFDASSMVLPLSPMAGYVTSITANTVIPLIQSAIANTSEESQALQKEALINFAVSTVMDSVFNNKEICRKIVQGGKIIRENRGYITNKFKFKSINLNYRGHPQIIKTNIKNIPGSGTKPWLLENLIRRDRWFLDRKYRSKYNEKKKINIVQSYFLDDKLTKSTSGLKREWRQIDVSLDNISPENGIYKIRPDNAQTMQEFNYYIKQNDDVYRVKWDNWDNTWRVIDPKHPGQFSYATPVRLNSNNLWETHADVGLKGGSLRYPSKKINHFSHLTEEQARKIRSLVWTAKDKAINTLRKASHRVKSTKPDDVQKVNKAFEIFIGSSSDAFKARYLANIKKQSEVLDKFKASADMVYQGGYKMENPFVLFETQYVNHVASSSHTQTPITAFIDGIVDANNRLKYPKEKFEDFVSTALIHESYHIINKDSPDFNYPRMQGDSLDISTLVSLTDPLLRNSQISDMDMMHKVFAHGWGADVFNKLLNAPELNKTAIKQLAKDRLAISNERVWKNPDNSSYMTVLISLIDTSPALYHAFVKKYDTWKREPNKPLLWDFNGGNAGKAMELENTDIGKLRHGDISPLEGRGLATGSRTDNINLKFDYIRNDKIISMPASKLFSMDDMMNDNGQLRGVMNTWKGSAITSKATDGTRPGIWGDKFTLSDNVNFINVVNGHSGTVAIKMPLSEIKEGKPLIITTGRLCGCTVAYAVEGGYFYVYHAGQRVGDKGWLTSRDGVSNLYENHLKLTNKPLPDNMGREDMSNDDLVDIFSQYEKSVITYFGKSISAGKTTRIMKQNPHVSIFDYNQALADADNPRIGLSYALLTKDGGKIKIKVYSEDLLINIGGGASKNVKFKKLSGEEFILKE